MARTLKLHPGLRSSLDRFGITHDALTRAEVARVVSRLESEPLPGQLDIRCRVLIFPNPGEAWARRVQGRSLWVLYRFDDANLMVLGVTVNNPAGFR